MTKRIDISSKTVFFIAAFLILLWVIFQILDIILLFFVSFILMSALTPLVNKLVHWKIPKVLAVLLVFLAAVSFLAALLAVGLTPLIHQTNSLSQKLADAVAVLLQTPFVDQSIIRQQMSSLSGQLVNFTFDVFRNLINFASILVVTIYMMLYWEKIENYIIPFFGSRQEKAQKILRMVEEKLGAWLRGQMVLSFIVGVLVFIGLLILGVEFALPLAIIAGLLEVVPVIGPIISAIPAVLIALTISPFLALLVAGLYVVIQQVEGHVIVPQIMKRAVGLNPLLVILAIFIGGRLLGLGGVFLAVPIAVVVQLVLQEGLRIEN